MARKVLIGVLSKRRFHSETEYERGSNFKTKFTTTICVPKVNPDEIFVIVTKPKEDDTPENKMLFEDFKKDISRKEIHYHNDVHEILIDNNVDNNVYLKILYRELYDKIQDGDEIYLDVTGGFRPIPLVLVEVIHYVQQIKNNVVIKDVFYGEYDSDKREGNFYSVGYFLDLTEWAIGVQNYVQYADASYLKRIVYSDEKYKDKVALNLVEELDLFSNYLKVCQWVDAQELYEEKISKHMDEFFGEVIPSNVLEEERLKDLKELLKSKFANYEKNHFLGAIEWCENHGNHQQALTLLNEFFKKHLINHGYVVSKNEDFEPFKSMNSNWKVDNWVIHENKENLELCIWIDPEYNFLLEIKERLSEYCNFHNPTFDELSTLVRIKKEKEENPIYQELSKFYDTREFSEEYKTLDWSLAYLIKQYLPAFVDDLEQKIAGEMGITIDDLDTIRVNIKIKGNKNWAKEVEQAVQKMNPTFIFSKELKGLYKNELITSRRALKIINLELEEAKKSYAYLRYRDLNDSQKSDDKKEHLPFEEKKGMMITPKFKENKQKLFNLFIDWNKIREYRNFINHGQTLDGKKYREMNYIFEKEKPEFKKSFERLLEFIEKDE